MYEDDSFQRPWRTANQSYGEYSLLFFCWPAVLDLTGWFIVSLLQVNVAVEHDPLMDVLSIFTYKQWSFAIATFDSRRVSGCQS